MQCCIFTHLPGPHFIQFLKRCINIFIFGSSLCDVQAHELYHHRRSKIITAVVSEEAVFSTTAGTNPTRLSTKGFSAGINRIIIVLYIGRAFHSFISFYKSDRLLILRRKQCYFFKIILDPELFYSQRTGAMTYSSCDQTIFPGRLISKPVANRDL